jgi:tetratricopeptide (TPR) repeat protein/SAM-dependent methyltransferase
MLRRHREERPGAKAGDAPWHRGVAMQTEHVPSVCPDAVRQAELAAIVTLYQAGRLEAIEERARRMTERYPGDVFGHNVLGTVFLQQDRCEAALPHLEKAVSLCPRESDIHNNLGIALLDLGRPNEALAHFRKAVSLRPDSATAHANLGNALLTLERPAEAEASYRWALAIKPDYAKAHYNLGNALKDLGRTYEAVASYQRAIALRPDYASALTNCGITLKERGQVREAEQYARQALAADPQCTQARNLLASILLLSDDDPADALDAVVRSLWVAERPDTRRLFVACAQRLELAHMDPTVQNLIIRAMTEPWDRPGLLTGVATQCVLGDPTICQCISRAVLAWPRRLGAEELYELFELEAVSRQAMLRCLLETAPIGSLELERFLTVARAALLAAAGREPPEEPGPEVLEFYSALARQCFINEYMFDHTADEAAQARALGQALDVALTADAPVAASRLVALACYRPLRELGQAPRLLERSWPKPVRDILAQQYLEPLSERLARHDIPRLTPIEDSVSRLVRRQYEENPYPRWVRAAPIDDPVAFDVSLRQRHPLARFTPLGHGRHLDVLIAGCGTGQHALETAQRYLGARVLAVDLSLSSLCYAKRKTEELGLTNITYAQADILRLGNLGRDFDLIESSGVLHHLADPLAGWRVLLSLLRPGGFMRLGLYSRAARREITRARARIASLGYQATAEDIRRCRQDLMDQWGGEEWRSIFISDFFSISGCRDLLFHVQEQCMTLEQIKAFLDAAHLTFVGFEIDAAVLARYARRFPEDRPATDLGNWSLFENEQPDTFMEMYQFWVQKPA